MRASRRSVPLSPWGTGQGGGLRGKTVLITAGPTREHLDPVRFLTNASSGLMGFALAKAARRLGARVVVVCGPTRITMPWGVAAHPVTTGEEMCRKTLALARRADVVIGAAAVSDWKFPRAAARKIKKTGRPLTITLLPNPDILAALGSRARRPFLVGFSLETHDWLEHARGKMRRKNLDLIVANRHTALGSDRTRVAVLFRAGKTRLLPPMSKERAAAEILRCVEESFARDHAGRR